MAINLAKIVRTGENVSVEFKEKFTDAIGKTICAFSNTIRSQEVKKTADITNIFTLDSELIGRIM